MISNHQKMLNVIFCQNFEVLAYICTIKRNPDYLLFMNKFRFANATHKHFVVVKQNLLFTKKCISLYNDL